MGWWNTEPDGRGGISNGGNNDHCWGDGPADIMDEAVSEISIQFKDAFGREPSMSELFAGLHFSACLIGGADAAQ